jgi:predicted nucleotidyltransferase
MRLSKAQSEKIKQAANELFGHPVEVILFGSRVDDSKRGGDVDIMVRTTMPVERPALMAARLGVRLSRLLDGRKVDVVIQAPSLKRQAIHAVAEQTGVRL